jgi:hypothetical protein
MRMQNLTISILVTALSDIGLVIAVILIENLLVKNGIVRGNRVVLIVTAACAILIKIIWFQNLSWIYFMVLAVLGLPLGVHRGDLWTTMQKGRWWWKNEDTFHRR